jgi:hypothetical protein
LSSPFASSWKRRGVERYTPNCSMHIIGMCSVIHLTALVCNTWILHTKFYLKTTIFWDENPCNMVEIYKYFGGMYCLHLQGWVVSGLLSDPRDKNSMFLWNNGKLLSYYTESHPQRQPLPWEPQIS